MEQRVTVLVAVTVNDLFENLVSQLLHDDYLFIVVSLLFIYCCNK